MDRWTWSIISLCEYRTGQGCATGAHNRLKYKTTGSTFVYQKTIVFINYFISFFYIFIYIRDIISAIDRLQYRAGKTNTAEALRMASTQIFGNTRLNRPHLKDIIVIFTDGGSNDMGRTILEARDAKLKGITILVVTVGGWVNQFEVKEIASHPAAKNVYNVRNYNSLSSIRRTLSSALCDGMLFLDRT